MYYTVIRFKPTIDREHIENVLCANPHIEFTHKGIHQPQGRVYLIEAKDQSVGFKVETFAIVENERERFRELLNQLSQVV